MTTDPGARPSAFAQRSPPAPRHRTRWPVQGRGRARAPQNSSEKARASAPQPSIYPCPSRSQAEAEAEGAAGAAAGRRREAGRHVRHVVGRTRGAIAGVGAGAARRSSKSTPAQVAKAKMRSTQIELPTARATRCLAPKKTTHGLAARSGCLAASVCSLHLASALPLAPTADADAVESASSRTYYEGLNIEMLLPR